MKKLNGMKFTFFALIIGIIITANIVNASTGPVDYYKGGIGSELKAIYGGDDNYYLPKDDWTNQRVYMSYARTTITNPCPNCTYIIKPYEQEIAWRVGITIQMGNTVEIPDSAYIGSFALYAKRVEFSLVSSTISGTWWID